MQQSDNKQKYDITTTSQDSDLTPIIYKVPKISENIFEYDSSPIFSVNGAFPRFNLGFHFYNHATKDKMAIVNELRTKKKFYYIVNKFEHFIDRYPDKSIATYTQDFLGKSFPKILSRGFYKLWEMIIDFHLIPTNMSEFVSAHLAEGPGSFMQATIAYRDMYVDKKHTSKNDKFYGITLHNEDIGKGHIPQLEQSFVDFYAKEKPKRVLVHKTYPSNEIKKGGKKTDGDLTKLNTIIQFGGNFKEKKADFITADGGFEWKNENAQEQESFMLIFGQFCTALTVQAEGGNLVMKVFETFSTVLGKLIVIAKYMYDEVFIPKPFLSRESNSEKYLVCKGFKGSKKMGKQITILLEILKEWESGKFMFDFFPDYELDANFCKFLTALNIDIANKQIEAINKIVIYINKQDYYGEEYHTFLDSQIHTSAYWKQLYLTDSPHGNKKLIEDMIKLALSKGDRLISSL